MANAESPARSAVRRLLDPAVAAAVRYGYRRIHVLLKREGWLVGKSQMYRWYREEQLQLRSKLPKRRKMVVQRKERRGIAQITRHV